MAFQNDKEMREQGDLFLPFFSLFTHKDNGDNTPPLIPVITMDAESKEVLMLAFMNEEALKLTLKTGEMHYWSRSRGSIWHKGDTSGQIQQVQSIKVDCDQDAILAMVKVKDNLGCCHLGMNSCFHRTLDFTNNHEGTFKLIKD